jgi:leucyl aminopeptidase
VEWGIMLETAIQMKDLKYDKMGALTVISTLPINTILMKNPLGHYVTL